MPAFVEQARNLIRTDGAPVVIAGAGPVGLTLALDLAWRGVEVVVVEQRRRDEPPPAKCNHVSARTMEIFRRLGVVAKVRNAGLPADHPHDVAYRTTFTGTELARIPIPCRRDRYLARGGPDTDWPTPEPPHRINQIYLEPILWDHAFQAPRLTLVEGHRVEGFEADDRAVRITAADVASGQRRVFEGAFLVGCDGGRSPIRKAIGARFEGDPVVQRCQSTVIRAPGLMARQRGAPAWGTFSLNPRRTGNVYAIDGREVFIVHNYLRDDEPDFDAVDRDASIRAILGVDAAFGYDVVAREDWYGRRLLADRFRRGRVFICGDAAHVWVPYAGYGMNAGVADAVNLGWLLAAHLHGWAPGAVLDAHERERRPITDQVSRFVMDHAHAMAATRRSVPDAIEAPGPDGDALRAEWGRRAYALNVQQYCAAGLNFGAYYESSPLVAHEATPPPPYTMAEFTPSTVPGCRTPHFELAPGRPLYDALGPEFTLIRLDPSVDATPLLDAARRRGVPLDLLDAPRDAAGPAYTTALVLSRPDQHVAWRGERCPDDPLALVDRVRGAGAGLKS